MVSPFEHPVNARFLLAVEVLEEMVQSDSISGLFLIPSSQLGKDVLEKGVKHILVPKDLWVFAQESLKILNFFQDH